MSHFSYLVSKLGKASEELALAEPVTDVRGLLAQLRARGGVWEKALAEDRVQVLVNRQFATPDTRIASSDEVGLVSCSAD